MPFTSTIQLASKKWTNQRRWIKYEDQKVNCSGMLKSLRRILLIAKSWPDYVIYIYTVRLCVWLWLCKNERRKSAEKSKRKRNEIIRCLNNFLIRLLGKECLFVLYLYWWGVTKLFLKLFNFYSKAKHLASLIMILTTNDIFLVISCIWIK